MNKQIIGLTATFTSYASASSVTHPIPHHQRLTSTYRYSQCRICYRQYFDGQVYWFLSTIFPQLPPIIKLLTSTTRPIKKTTSELIKWLMTFAEFVFRRKAGKYSERYTRLWIVTDNFINYSGIAKRPLNSLLKACSLAPNL